MTDMTAPAFQTITVVREAFHLWTTTIPQNFRLFDSSIGEAKELSDVLLVEPRKPFTCRTVNV